MNDAAFYIKKISTQKFGQLWPARWCMEWYILRHKKVFFHMVASYDLMNLEYYHSESCTAVLFLPLNMEGGGGPSIQHNSNLLHINYETPFVVGFLKLC